MSESERETAMQEGREGKRERQSKRQRERETEGCVLRAAYVFRAVYIHYNDHMLPSKDARL